MTRKKFIASLAFREREAKRRATKAARPVLKEDKIMNERTQNIGLGCLAIFLVFVALCGVVFFIWNPLGLQLTTTRQVEAPAPAVTQAPIVVVVEYPTAQPALPTEPVVDPTQAPVLTEAPTPVAVSCETPSIQAEVTLDGKPLSASGEFLDTVLGKRMTFTSRRLLVPDKAWNDPLTSDELKTVEETWQVLQVCVPDGVTGRIFAGGFEQGVYRFETGALLTLTPGLYEFNLRNAEIVLWYPGQEEYSKNDLDRIVTQIREGNFDIKSELAFLAVTADLMPKIPSDLVKERNVQIVPAPKNQ